MKHHSATFVITDPANDSPGPVLPDSDGRTLGEVIGILLAMAFVRDGVPSADPTLGESDPIEDDWEDCCRRCGHVFEICDCEDGPTIP